MTKALERREKLRADLIQAAERMIASRGLAGLKTRDLAREIGCANGAVYNLVADVDELVLRVGSRTLRRLDETLSAAETAEHSPQQMLVRIAIAYCDFAAENLELWRAMFEHRMEADKALPDWSVDDQLQLFRHIYKPLAALFPERGTEELGITARSLFSAVHGMVALGLEQRLVAVPLPALRKEIAGLVRAMIDGLIRASELAASPD
ncbi:TetR/AcrR family transcriptional regulator [Bradyrhizobium betae]|uniref:TetR family transcriptional regulator n=1 Tax=Bradyrhizobium betae TaxID=244734 RepID=A0A4Q1UH31_9BRAD|nr:WHG domain-containing protein [Bradyrhizobium betae]RXT33583.1 TetR family transcriptional regulator [Bradyrhizobium betae]